MSDDIAERIRKRAYRLAAKDFNGDGAKLAMEAADEISRLRAENNRFRENELLLSKDGKTWRSAIDIIKEISTDLAAVTAERDRMRDAFEKAAKDMHPMLRSMISRNEASEIVRRAARAALEGLTNKSGDGNE